MVRFFSGRNTPQAYGKSAAEILVFFSKCLVLLFALLIVAKFYALLSDPAAHGSAPRQFSELKNNFNSSWIFDNDLASM